MTFRRKLFIAFTTIIILPMVLVTIAFFVIGNVLARSDGSKEFLSYSQLSENMQSYAVAVENVYDEIRHDYQENPEILENYDYLDKISEELRSRNTYLLIRKGSQLYYSGNEEDSELVFRVLPGYGSEADQSGVGLYLNNMNRFVKQLDFTFSDGSKGSLFIVTHVARMESKKLIAGMFFAMMLTLFLTALGLTSWLRRSMFEPINQLNIAMKNIGDGNLDYILSTTEKGEIGELYQNYEEMRLRLKESATEKLEDEKNSRELISNISHDLKTPITSIKGYVEGLMDGIANTPEKQSKYLHTIYNKANDMNNLINELTLYSKIDSNKIPYNFRKLNVAEYFADCVEEIGMDMEWSGIELNYSNLVSPDTMIIADPEQLKRVINNIIGNSVKYMDKPHGRIDIRVLDEQDSVRVEIEDNGKGIAQRDLPNIFDRFYRADSSRNSAKGGSGIGLSIVKKIIEDHGGYIWATSQEGAWTRMQFVLRKYREKEKDAVV